MKFIFDFDDVLFYNTALLKKHMYEALENAGVPYEKANKFYKESREKGFSMKKFIYELIEKENTLGIKIVLKLAEIVAQRLRQTDKELSKVKSQLERLQTRDERDSHVNKKAPAKEENPSTQSQTGSEITH